MNGAKLAGIWDDFRRPLLDVGSRERGRGMVPIFHDAKDGLISASKMVNK